MNIEQIINDINEKKSSIESTYNKYMKKIDDWTKELDEVPRTYKNNSPQYKEQQKKKLEQKIKDAQDSVEKWMKKAQSDMDQWLQNKQDIVTKQLEKAAKDLLKSREEFKNKDE